MENKQKGQSGILKLLAILLSVLLVVSIVLNVVLYVDNGDLNKQADTLTGDNAGLQAQLDALTETAAQSEAGLAAANATIDQLHTDMTTAEETIASQTDSLGALQAAFDSLTGVAAQSEADLTAANATIGQLQADAVTAEATIVSQKDSLDALQAEYDAYQTSAEAAIQQGESDLKAAQDSASQTITALQASLDALQAEINAYLTPAAIEAPVEEVAETESPAADETAETETTPAIAPDAVAATVNGQDVTGAMVLKVYQAVVNYYGEPEAADVELYYSVAMEEAITMELIKLTAAEMGVDQFTQEELDALYATSDDEWQYALDNYVSYNLTETDETTDEERAAAYAEAEDYYGAMGYSKEILRQNYLDDAVFERVQDELCKDVTVTDEEVLAYYDEAVQSDKDIYEFDIDAYENQMLMFQYGYADSTPWYRPEGYRYIKHILLDADQELLDAYTSLQGLYDEQEGNVTAEEVDAAKAAVIASVQDKIDEINQKLSEGVSFDDLMAEYGADPGMTSGDYPNGYEVALASSGFVPAFVAAAFSVDNAGDVSVPYLSEYGVHIVKYVADVPAGPIELTDDLKATITQNLMDDKRNTVMNDWHDSADIVYTGIIRSIEEIQGSDAE